MQPSPATGYHKTQHVDPAGSCGRTLPASRASEQLLSRTQRHLEEVQNGGEFG